MGRIVFFLSVICFLAVLVPRTYAAESETKGESGPPPEFAYIQLDPINLPIITAKGLTQQVSLLVSLEIEFADKEKVSVYKPRLTDAYIQDLYGAIGAGYAMMKGNVVDVQQIKQRLTSVTDKVLGPDLKAHDVLLQVIQQRAL
ncbi:MAG: flagellar basal body-associated FliL family protein [Proteobacteria bacterium]|nr:flagellar basal body-associated FliL family protein [Pseudomonadota bacterium]